MILESEPHVECLPCVHAEREPASERKDLATLPQDRPESLPLLRSAIPEELQSLPQWVLWRYEEKDGAWKKPPYRTDGETKASVSESDSWCSFGEAIQAAGYVEADGIGFVLTEGDPYTAVDLDSCHDPETGELTPAAAEIVEKLSSYTEISPSGRGIRIFIKGTRPAGTKSRNGGVEVYSSRRYVTVTGQHVSGMPSEIPDREQELATVCRKFLSADSGANGSGNPPMPSISRSSNDEELLQKARNAKNGDKFSRLFNDGDWEADRYPSPSEADGGLCEILCFWSGKLNSGAVDCEQVDRLFRQSALMRNKWDEMRESGGSTYGAMTLEKAVGMAAKNLLTMTPTPPRSGRGRLPIYGLADLMESGCEEPDWLWEGFIARGMMTELHAAPKLGKTTLLLYMVKAFLEDQDFLDRSVGKGIRTLYLTEQTTHSFKQSLRDVGISAAPRESLRTLHQPEVARDSWKSIAEQLRFEVVEEPFDLLIVDTISQFAKLKENEENYSGPAYTTLGPLRALTQELDVAVLVVRHDRKGNNDTLEGARGNSAWTGIPDITIGMSKEQKGGASRKLEAIGRGPDVGGKLVFERGESGYAVIEGSSPASRRQRLRDELPGSADQAATYDELVERTGLSRSTLERDLKKMKGVERVGAGGKKDPFRVWLAPTEEPVN